MFNIKQEVLGRAESMVTGTSQVNTTLNQLNVDYSTDMLQGMLNPDEQLNMNNLYREIYLMDTVSGPTVDLMCTLPWSDYDLIGIKDKKVLQIYQDSLEELDIVDLMIQSSTNYLVLGELIGSLIFNEDKGIFTDCIIQNPDDCVVEGIPLRGYDPKIDLKVPKDFKKFLRSKDPRDREAVSELPPKILQAYMKQTTVPLEPLSTIYLARNHIPGIDCVSYYHRIVPIWLIEKALMRGTIIGAWRRQRAILHVQVGDDEWFPDSNQLQSISQLFTNADQDAQGAVVTTRRGVEINEIRDGSNFWKISDEWDIFANAKMRALGVNESFLCLSGDTYVSSDKGLLQLNSICDWSKMKKDTSKEIDLTVKGKQGNLVKATKFWYRGKDIVYELRTKRGFKLKSTKDHKYLSIGKELQPEWVKLKDIKETTHLCIELNGKDLVNNKLELDLQDVDMSVHATNTIYPTKPTTMSTKLAYLLGLVTTDGSISEYCVDFHNSDKVVLKRFKDFIKSLFDLEVSIYHSSKKGSEYNINGVTGTSKVDTYCYTVNNKICASWFVQLGIDFGVTEDGNRRGRDFIPWSILKSDRECKLAFLAGFIDGDGSVSADKQVTFYNHSQSMLSQIRILCADLGYPTYQMLDYPNCIKMTSSIGSNFHNEIYKYIGHRGKKYDAKPHIGSRTIGIPIPLVLNFLKTRYVEREINVGEWFENDEGDTVLIETFGRRTSKFIGSMFSKNKRTGVLPYYNFTAGLYEDFLDIIYTISEVFHKRLVTLSKIEYLFDTKEYVTEIGKEHLFDLTIERSKSPSFVANGIVVHNSGDSNFSTMEVSLSTFMDSLRTFRQNMTKNIIYNKIFLMLAKFHDIKKTTEAQLAHRTRITSHKNLSDSTKYNIPTIKWQKDLVAKYDQSYIDMLNVAEEKGIPVPLVLYASASGLSKDDIIGSLEDDVAFRKDIKMYNERLAKEGLVGGESEEGDMFSSTRFKNMDKTKIPKEMIISGKQMDTML